MITSEFRDLMLERLKVGFAQEGSYVARHATPDVVLDVMTDHMAARLTSHVLAERMEPSKTTVTFETYASLWQHTKAVWFRRLSRALNRPPRMRSEVRVVTVDNFATFPECRMDYPPDLGRPVRVSLVRTVEGAPWAAEQ